MVFSWLQRNSETHHDARELIQLDTWDIRPLPGVLLKHFTAHDVISRWNIVSVYSRAIAITAAHFLDTLESKVGAKEVLVVGSGGIEKNVDLMLCRRFKGRGMSWSRAGAQNLLELRLLRYDRRDWNAYWRRRVN